MLIGFQMPAETYANESHIEDIRPVAAPDLLLEPGMVIAPEWFIETPYGLILFEENFLVGESGLERLTDFPSKLQVIAN